MKNTIKIFIFLTLIIGIMYPLLIFGIGKTFFAHNANGSLLYKDQTIIGSSLIAQEFKEAKYFHPRPSAVDYNPLSSGASNYGPISKKFSLELESRKNLGLKNEMLFTSGSGLDPHISPDSAIEQVERIIKARNIDYSKKDLIINLIAKHTINKKWSILGNDLVNVLELNIALDKGNF